MSKLGGLVVAAWFCTASLAAQPWQKTESDFRIQDFHFRSGDTLPELKIHYVTLGSLHRDANGHVSNAVLLRHGTGGSLLGFLGPRYSVLFQPGQPLDASYYYVIIPDGIGHGHSSKPSDGMRTHFPHYEYEDMIEAQYRLVREGLHVDHLKFVSGISMGGMHTWLWGEDHPEMVDDLFPLVCMPVEIAGRNRLWRDYAMYLITTDPEYADGAYKQEPHGLKETLTLFDLIIERPPASAEDRAKPHRCRRAVW